MKHPLKAKTPSLHPNAQVIITGKPLTPEQACDVIEFSQGLSVTSWCGVDGSIGHIDSIRPNTTFEKLYGDLEELGRKFSFLELGVSVMSGPPGSFTIPVASFQIKQSLLKRKEDVHFGHPPPKRMKNTRV
jgi:hypothetical protein